MRRQANDATWRLNQRLPLVRRTRCRQSMTALTVYRHILQAAKGIGAPIDWFALQPTIARANGIGIARHAPNPNAALPFYEYMLSAAGAQKTLASLGYVPTSSGLSSPVPNLTIKLVDPVVMLDQVEKWNKSFQEIFVKRSGQ